MCAGSLRDREVSGTGVGTPLAALPHSPHLPSLLFLAPGSLWGAVARYRYPLCVTGCVISL